MKKQFLEELKGYLSPLSLEERNEILRFYEERFETGLRYEGKTEQEVLDELESPKQIARNVMEEYGYEFKPKSAVQTEKDEAIKIGSLIGLILFDVFLASVLVPLFFGLFVGFGTSLLAFIASMIIIPIVERGINTSLLLFAIGLGYLWLLLVLWLWDVLIGFITWLVRWHLKVLKYSHTRPVVKTLRGLKISTIIRRSPRLLRTRNFLSLVSIVLIVGGMFLGVMRFGSFDWATINAPLEEETFNYVIDEEDLLTITSKLNFANVSIRRGDVDEIQVILKYLEEDPILVDYNEGTALLTLEQESHSIQQWFNFGSLLRLFQSSPAIDIIIPEDVEVMIIDLDMSSGRVTLEELEGEEIIVRTLNGAIAIRNVSVEQEIDVRTSNGRIDLNNVKAERITLRSSNGKIVLNKVDARHYELNTSNGNIELEDINELNKDGVKLNATTSNGSIIFDEVYVKDVRIKTTNGSITYINSDLLFILDRLEATTTNGSKTINVPYNG